MAIEYEALVKIEDNVNESLSQEEQGALWKAGDIVDIHPKGWVWSRMEVKHFLIVNLGFLEEAEAEALLEEVAIEEADKDGIVHKELVARSRHSVDVTKLLGELPEKVRADVFDRDKETQPFRQLAINPSDIEDITLRPDIQQALLGV